MFKLSQEKYKFEQTKKRTEDKEFDKKFKEKEAARKREQRKRKAEAANQEENKDNEITIKQEPKDTNNENESDSTSGLKVSNSLFNQSEKSRQAVAGLQRRKKTNTEKNMSWTEMKGEHKKLLSEMKQMDESLQEADIEKEELKIENQRLNHENKTLKEKEKTNDFWLNKVFKYLPAKSKREFRTAYQLAQPEIEMGTTRRIMENTGINMSKKLPENTNTKSELKVKIEKFAEENSSEMPDMRNEKKKIRYRHHFLTCLHDDFRYENPEIEVSYTTFSAYWPKNIIKPKPGDYANCVCEKCENPALKIRALKSHKILSQEQELETILRDIKENDLETEENFKSELKSLLEEPNASKQVKFLVWEKVETTEVNKNTGKQKKATTQRVLNVLQTKDLVIELLTDYQDLKDHLERANIIKEYIKVKREEAADSDDKVMLQVDWAENGEIINPREVQSAFFGGRTKYSIHSGYEYSSQNPGGFVSFSDENDHKAEAIHAAMNPKIKELADKQIKEITIVSDSPTSQYRNAKCAYLTSKWSKEYGITICWIFTEAGHGKSAADGIGGGIKNKTQEKINMNPDTVINNVKDIKDNIETGTEIYIHTKEDIKEVKESLPNKLGPLKGATTLHELMFYPDGKIKKKNLPTDTYFNPVNIKVGRTVTRKKRAPQQTFLEEEDTNLEEEAEHTNFEETPEVMEIAEMPTPRYAMRTRKRIQADIIAELSESDESDSSESEDE